MSGKPAFLPVIAFLKLIQVIDNLYIMLFSTQKMGKSSITCKKQIIKIFFFFFKIHPLMHSLVTTFRGI